MYYHEIRHKNQKRFFCCLSCSTKQKNIDSKAIRIEKYNLNPNKCNLCGNFLNYKQRENKYCGHSCSAIYSNTHKTKGYRRSKLEIYLEQKLKITYPYLDFKFNEKSIINSELDIYIPVLKLAFELNGIFHYKPIYGESQLLRIISNDNKKMINAIKNNLELHCLDISEQNKFSEKSSLQYLYTIQKIIDDKLLLG